MIFFYNFLLKLLQYLFLRVAYDQNILLSDCFTVQETSFDKYLLDEKMGKTIECCGKVPHYFFPTNLLIIYPKMAALKKVNSP